MAARESVVAKDQRFQFRRQFLSYAHHDKITAVHATLYQGWWGLRIKPELHSLPRLYFGVRWYWSEPYPVASPENASGHVADKDVVNVRRPFRRNVCAKVLDGEAV
jgi:hypothetical protein